jgi:sulfoxide reductase heme-binding subunit YedZ
LAYIIIFLLAITTPKWVKKRTGKNWKKLHRFIYYAAGAALLHYFWQLKGNLAEPLFYLIIIGLLLSFRVLVWFYQSAHSRLMIPKSRK